METVDMEASNMQIVEAYEKYNGDISPEDIAMDMGYPTEAVKTILLQHSSVFQKNALQKNPVTKELELRDEELFSRHDMKTACSTIKELCVSSEVDSVRLKAAVFIIDERQGRNDLKALKENKFNIVMISETMAKARAGIAEAKARAQQNKLIEMAA